MNELIIKEKELKSYVKEQLKNGDIEIISTLPINYMGDEDILNNMYRVKEPFILLDENGKESNVAIGDCLYVSDDESMAISYGVNFDEMYRRSSFDAFSMINRAKDELYIDSPSCEELLLKNKYILKATVNQDNLKYYTESFNLFNVPNYLLSKNNQQIICINIGDKEIAEQIIKSITSLDDKERDEFVKAMDTIERKVYINKIDEYNRLQADKIYQIKTKRIKNKKVIINDKDPYSMSLDELRDYAKQIDSGYIPDAQRDIDIVRDQMKEEKIENAMAAGYYDEDGKVIEEKTKKPSLMDRVNSAILGENMSFDYEERTRDDDARGSYYNYNDPNS